MLNIDLINLKNCAHEYRGKQAQDVTRFVCQDVLLDRHKEIIDTEQERLTAKLKELKEDIASILEVSETRLARSKTQIKLDDVYLKKAEDHALNLKEEILSKQTQIKDADAKAQTLQRHFDVNKELYDQKEVELSSYSSLFGALAQYQSQARNVALLKSEYAKHLRDSEKKLELRSNDVGVKQSALSKAEADLSYNSKLLEAKQTALDQAKLAFVASDRLSYERADASCWRQSPRQYDANCLKARKHQEELELAKRNHLLRVKQAQELEKELAHAKNEHKLQADSLKLLKEDYANKIKQESAQLQNSLERVTKIERIQKELSATKNAKEGFQRELNNEFYQKNILKNDLDKLLAQKKALEVEIEGHKRTIIEWQEEKLRAESALASLVQLESDKANIQDEMKLMSELKEGVDTILNVDSYVDTLAEF